MSSTHHASEELYHKLEDGIEWVRNNKLKAVGYTWLAGVTGTLAYQWGKPIPPSLKIIHARVYAQGITLASLAAMAAIEMTAEKPAAKKEEDY